MTGTPLYQSSANYLVLVIHLNVRAVTNTGLFISLKLELFLGQQAIKSDFVIVPSISETINALSEKCILNGMRAPDFKFSTWQDSEDISIFLHFYLAFIEFNYNAEKYETLYITANLALPFTLATFAPWNGLIKFVSLFNVIMCYCKYSGPSANRYYVLTSYLRKKIICYSGVKVE